MLAQICKPKQLRCVLFDTCEEDLVPLLFQELLTNVWATSDDLHRHTVQILGHAFC